MLMSACAVHNSVAVAARGHTIVRCGVPMIPGQVRGQMDGCCCPQAAVEPQPALVAVALQNQRAERAPPVRRVSALLDRPPVASVAAMLRTVGGRRRSAAGQAGQELYAHATAISDGDALFARCQQARS